MPFFFRFRDTVASLPSLGILLLLILVGMSKTPTIARPHDDSLVQIALITAEPVVVPKPVPVVPTPAPTSTPRPVVIPPVAPPRPSMPVAASAVASELPALPMPSKTIAPVVPAEPVAVVPPVAVPAAVAVKARAVSPDAEYIAAVRAHLNRIKRYPTGREASQLRPQGKVRIWFVLQRDGSVVDVGLEQSSNSMLLDDAARKTINRATFAAFPEASWAGESSHRFSAELEFVPAA
ncbi:Ferric siderophore transport system, periplasmic binding protein TonB [Oxalobacteraceae bacterium IMCC9480]|nr:Ferric siderophore transport system, periplasmic binding protein TonB [Oxalobacteraceae bacterium IMCC9480]